MSLSQALVNAMSLLHLPPELLGYSVVIPFFNEAPNVARLTGRTPGLAVSGNRAQSFEVSRLAR